MVAVRVEKADKYQLKELEKYTYSELVERKEYNKFASETTAMCAGLRKSVAANLESADNLSK